MREHCGKEDDTDRTVVLIETPCGERSTWDGYLRSLSGRRSPLSPPFNLFDGLVQRLPVRPHIRCPSGCFTGLSVLPKVGVGHCFSGMSRDVAGAYFNHSVQIAEGVIVSSQVRLHPCPEEQSIH